MRGSRGPRRHGCVLSPVRRAIASEFSRFAKKQFEDGKIGFAALLPGDSNNDSKRIAVMLFRGKDVAAAMKICEADALVRDEKLTIQAFPQYLAKGAME